MSKEDWLRHFERLQAEYPNIPDNILDVLAREALRDEAAKKADWARLLGKEGRE